MKDTINYYSRRQALKRLIGSLALPLGVSAVLPFGMKAHAQESTPPLKKGKHPSSIPKELFDDTPLKPTRVFDNLYCFGTKSVVVWVIKTSEGLMMIDSMWDNIGAELICKGLEHFGMSPSDMKYIILTHGHGDHYGGAEFFKERYGAKIFMTEVDTHFMQTTNTGANGPRSPKCEVDHFMVDGQKIQLGDAGVTIVETPGHTPGCASLIYDVKDGDGIATVGQWGGSGLPRDLKWKRQYLASIDHFAEQLKRHQATVSVGAHLFVENGYAKLDAAGNKKPGDINPFTIGEDGFLDYLQRLRDKVKKAIAVQEQANLG